ncbi:xRE family transcriptional regulator [Firmicutes bacterium CAG:41]|nr:xRE family transcriptional regulator [Firmicutes bacterium CAG:41]
MIGRRIKELRTENGLTQQELAKILNVSSMSISFYENEQRKPDSEFIIACSRFFDVSTDYLLGKTYKRRIPREERFGAFSKRLKHVRELKGISQRQAAEDLNISPQNLSYYENGRDAGYGLLVRMARYYDVIVEYLIGASPVMQRENVDINKDIGLNDKTINLLRQRNKFGYSYAADIVNEIVRTEYFQRLVTIFSEDNESKEGDTPQQKELNEQIVKVYGGAFFIRKRDWEIERCINGIARELRKHEIYPVDDCERSMEE